MPNKLTIVDHYNSAVSPEIRRHDTELTDMFDTTGNGIVLAVNISGVKAITTETNGYMRKLQ